MVTSLETMAAVTGLGLTALALGCSSPATPLAEAPVFEPVDQAKCQVVKDQDEPLIIEWPAAERASLEALAKRGAVVVRYQGCDMEVLTRCHLARPYGYTPTTPQHEQVTIRNEDELYARLPLGAVRLAGELERSGQLAVSMTIVGTYENGRQPVTQDELEGQCSGATHVVNAMTVGAFEFTTGAAARVGVGADAVVAGGGAQSETQRTTLDRGGDRAACDQATGDDEQPPYGCGALLRVEVARIAPAVAPAAPPAATASAGQPGDATIEPGTATCPTDIGGPPAPATPPGPAADPVDPPTVAAPAPHAEPRLSSAPPPVSPDQPEDDGMVWAYVTVGTLGAALVAGIIIGAVIKANEDEEESYEPQPGDLGDETLVLRLPVIRW
ncbi:MAG: hypothetical protein JRI68_05245 [Deltaproteobacteria bacterium]|nr:hypothetical protein [Deltaproteobacteria bacterium]